MHGTRFRGSLGGLGRRGRVLDGHRPDPVRHELGDGVVLLFGVPLQTQLGLLVHAEDGGLGLSAGHSSCHDFRLLHRFSPSAAVAAA